MPDETLVEYEMGYGADEFGNVLNGTFSGDKSRYRCNEIDRHRWAVQHAGESFTLVIMVTEKPPRKLGLFRLPVLEVKFSFTDTDAVLRDQFFHRFHQYFHKGGG